MMALSSALYVGRVMHRRLQPVRHRLAYHVFYLLLDLDELPAQAKRLTLLGCNGAGLLSFHEKDHGPGDGTSLRTWIDVRLAEAGLEPAAAVRLLCIPRMFGYAFNPLSIYYCHRADGTLFATLLQVNNTFGQRHSYLLVKEPDARGVMRQRFDKSFYVSPFMDMEMSYDVRLAAPGPTLSFVIRQDAGKGTVMVAALNALRHELTDRALLRALISQPLLSLKVIAGIHVEALILWLKGMRLRPRPAAPANAVSVAGGPKVGRP